MDDQVRATVEAMAEKSHSHKCCPHLVPDNQCLSSGRKWCYVGILRTRFVSVYIIISFYPVDAILETRLKIAITKHFTAADLTKTVWTRGPGAQFGARILAWILD